MGRTDQKKKGTDEERRRRQAEQTRSFSDARRKGSDAGRKLGDAPKAAPESDAGHKIAAGVDLAVHTVKEALELAGKAGAAAGAELVGGALLVGKMGYDYGKAWGDMTQANAQAWRTAAVDYGANIVGRHARNPESPHIKDGKPFTAGEIKELTNRDYGADMKSKMKTEHLGVDAKKQEQLKDEGYKRLADTANTLLGQCRTPEQRQATLSGLQDGIGAAKDQRAADLRQRQQPQQPPPGGGQQ